VLIAVALVATVALILYRKDKIQKDEIEGGQFLLRLLILVFKNITIKDAEIKKNIGKILGYILDALTLAMKINPKMSKDLFKQIILDETYAHLRAEGISINQELDDLVELAIDYILDHYYKEDGE
jgi:actin-like ATPase involved in cell morphogenesis